SGPRVEGAVFRVAEDRDRGAVAGTRERERRGIEAGDAQDRDVLLAVDDERLRPVARHADALAARDDMRRGDDDVRLRNPAASLDAEPTRDVGDPDDTRMGAPHGCR